MHTYTYAKTHVSSPQEACVYVPTHPRLIKQFPFCNYELVLRVSSSVKPMLQIPIKNNAPATF